MILPPHIKIYWIIKKILLLIASAFITPTYACHILLCNSSTHMMVVSGYSYFGIKGKSQTSKRGHSIPVVNVQADNFTNHNIPPNACTTIIYLRSIDYRLIHYAGLTLQKLYILTELSRVNILKEEYDFNFLEGDPAIHGKIPIDLGKLCPSNILGKIKRPHSSSNTSNYKKTPNTRKSCSNNHTQKNTLEIINEEIEARVII